EQELQAQDEVAVVALRQQPAAPPPADAVDQLAVLDAPGLLVAAVHGPAAEVLPVEQRTEAWFLGASHLAIEDRQRPVVLAAAQQLGMLPLFVLPPGVLGHPFLDETLKLLQRDLAVTIQVGGATQSLQDVVGKDAVLVLRV